MIWKKLSLKKLKTKELKEMNKGKEENNLAEELETLKNEYKTFQEDVEKKELNRKKLICLEKNLTQAGLNPDVLDLITNSFDLDKINVTEDGKIIDFHKEIDTLKQSKPSIFKVEELKSEKEPIDGANPVFTKEEFNKLSYKEKVELYSQNKELYLNMRG